MPFKVDSQSKHGGLAVRQLSIESLEHNSEELVVPCPSKANPH